jgi:hypothetical protein
MRGFSRSFLHVRFLRVLTSLAVVAGSGALIAGGAGPVARAVASVAAVQAPDAGAQPVLLPAPGQFVSVSAQRVLDTRFGTGESGGAAQLAAGGSLAVTVAGFDGVPTDATSVVVNVTALNTTAPGYLTTYNSDNSDPNVAAVGVRAGISTNQTDTIPVSSTGQVSVANHSSAPLDVVMTLMGYYTGSTDTSAGDTYGNAPWVKIVDTTSGLGTPQAQVPAGGSVTVQVSGQGGIAAGADTAVVQLSALNATDSGYLTAYAAGTSDPGASLLFYDSSMTYRDLAYVPLSSAGQLTIANHGSAAVDLAVVTRGYFMPPSATPVGAEYAPAGPVTVYGTSSGGAQVAANSSVTFQVAGTAGLPATGVVEVAEHVVVTSPAASGFLDVYRGSGTDPNNATMNFLAGDGTDVGYQDSILSQVSPSGQETITNHSSGTVNVQVAVVGMFFDPQVPPAPAYLKTAATYTTTPLLSGTVQDATGDDPTGEIFLFDSSGNPIGGSPTATGQVASGESISWPVTAGTLTDGDTYQWYMETCDQGVCSDPSPTQTFTVNTANAPGQPVATATAAITGSSVTGTDAITDPGACSGADCPTSSNATLNAGYDGTRNWESGIKLDLSSIPAGSDIVSATLQLTESGCLTGTSCSATTFGASQAVSDVTAAATGPQLAAAAAPGPYAATVSGNHYTWDITGMVGGWLAGDAPNDGLVIQAAAAGNPGISFYSPAASAAASRPQVTIGYIPPAVPSAPAGLTVTPGDGGALVSWSDPAWNYVDDIGNSTASFTVNALTSAGTVAATQTTSADQAVLTGLTNGTHYTIKVTATNAIGTGPAATSAAVIPAAVPGGTSQYVTAVSQFLTAQDAIASGTAATAAGALSNSSQAPVDIAPLSNQDLTDSLTAAALAANDEQDTSDSTSISNTLAMLSPDGSTVTVYAAADETFTTVDTSSGTAESIPGDAENNYLFTFSSPGSSPQLTGYVDANAAIAPAGEDGNQTAFSAILDGPAMAADDSGAPAPLATDSYGNLLGGEETVPTQSSGPYDAAATAAWALKNDCRAHSSACNNGYTDDCTDFVSRGMHYGGGWPEIWRPGRSRILPASKQDPDAWYNYRYSVMGLHFDATAHDWANSEGLAKYERRYVAYFYKYVHRRTNVSPYIIPGAIIFAASHNENFSHIFHAAIVTRVTHRNLYVTQHSPNFAGRPLWAAVGTPSWFNDHPFETKAAWVTDPQVISSYVCHPHNPVNAC